jgi:anthranilate synthase component 2
MHGKVSTIRHTEDPLFAELPERMRVTRYHSLIVEPQNLPPELTVLAWTDEPGWEDEIQALRHRDHPVWGVQFHPESIASEGGMQIMRNFMEHS